MHFGFTVGCMKPSKEHAFFHGYIFPMKRFVVESNDGFQFDGPECLIMFMGTIPPTDPTGFQLDYVFIIPLHVAL